MLFHEDKLFCCFCCLGNLQAVPACFQATCSASRRRHSSMILISENVTVHLQVTLILLLTGNYFDIVAVTLFVSRFSNFATCWSYNFFHAPIGGGSDFKIVSNIASVCRCLLWRCDRTLHSPVLTSLYRMRAGSGPLNAFGLWKQQLTEIWLMD